MANESLEEKSSNLGIRAITRWTTPDGATFVSLQGAFKHAEAMRHIKSFQEAIFASGLSSVSPEDLMDFIVKNEQLVRDWLECDIEI